MNANRIIGTPGHPIEFGRKHGFFAALTILSLLIPFLPQRAFASGIVCTPQVLFGSDKQKSVRVGVYNPSDASLEVWVDIKYGYTATDDTGRIAVITPDSLQPDDRSAAGWIKAFPVRFILGPNEMQTVRLVTNPPPGTPPGEYWARILVSSKDQSKPFVKGKKGFGGKVDVISVASVPFQFRNAEATTGLQLTGTMDYKVRDSTVDVRIPLKRTGDASYWGTVECKLVDGAGKTAYSSEENLVVFKDLLYTIKLPRKNIPAGTYTLNMVAKTERTDVRNVLLTRCAPIPWSLPIVVP